jgi:uncharacterized protein (TIGR03118 family)
MKRPYVKKEHIMYILHHKARGSRSTARSRRFSSRPLIVESLEPRCMMSGNAFVQTALVSSMPGVARHTNADLVNPWGIVASGESQFQVTINGTGNAMRLNQAGAALGQPITLPPPAGSPAGTTAAPSGEVANSTSAFMITEGSHTAPATLLFSTEDGTISGFNAKVDKTKAILAVDESANGDVFKGLATGSVGGKNYVYATDFHNGVVDVFDSTFATHTFSSGQFTDPHPVAGFAPFGISDINGTIFVTYAKQNAEAHDDVAGAGNGFIDAFDASGNFVSRVATGSGAGGTNTNLNSPWGMVMAPGGFGPVGGDLLVGNFGDSHVTAFNVSNLMAPIDNGQLQDSLGKPLVLTGGVMGTDFANDTKGLWGLAFGKGEFGKTLFFTAGINDENDGLFGTVTLSGRQHDHDDDGQAVTNDAKRHGQMAAGAALMNSSVSSNNHAAIDAVLAKFDLHKLM